MKLGLIGCGKMGSALLKGVLVADKEQEVEAVHVFDAYQPAMAALVQADPRIRARDSNLEVADAAEVLFLCVKPDAVPAVAREISASKQPALCISIAAGVTLEALENHLGSAHRVIRVMPNTPALVGAGAAAYAPGSRATPEDSKLAGRLLRAVGVASEVPEKLLDAVTGLSGSGPAYVYLVIEALADGGVLQGLPRPVALELAAQTVFGAAKMVLETGEHPAALKDQVTSPAGTTMRGLAALEREGLRHALMAAVSDATERSRELGRG